VAFVASYHLDTYEVTVGRFRRYVEAFSSAPAPGSGANPQIPGSGWSDTNELPTLEHVNFRCEGDGMEGCNSADILDVGSRLAGAARWGTMDLSGSMYEHVLDMYGPYSSATCNNCAKLDGGLDRVQRGGSWFNGTNSDGHTRSTQRVLGLPSQRFFTLGFRCAR
jgi:formylglycine-generating enzyme required for sulfatase activity